MPDQKSPFNSEYSKSSQTTSRQSAVSHKLASLEKTTAVSQTASVETGILPPVHQLIEPYRYGSGKPRRVVIRGRISRE